MSYSIHLKQKDMLGFWNCIKESYNIEKMYDYTQNVKVSLRDKYGSSEFIYFKDNQERLCIHILILGNIAATLFLSEGGMDGDAKHERGKREFLQCLKMFQKSISSGYIEMEVASNSSIFANPNLKTNFLDFVEEDFNELNVRTLLEMNSQRVMEKEAS